MRPLVIVPLGCSIIGLVLSFLCIFAGNRPGFMNDYQIVTLNTSTIGHDILPNIPKTNPFTILDEDDGLLNQVSGLTDQLNGIINDFVDDVTRSLGVQQFYNWHLRNFCEGKYEPRYNDSSASFAVKDCSDPTASYHFKIADIIDKQLRVGPLHISLKDLKWPDKIQKNLDSLSKALQSALAFYSISIAAIIISLLTGLLVLFGNTSLLLSLITWALLILSFVSLLVCSIIVSIVNSRAIKIVSENANKIGVYAYSGHKYLALTWCAAVIMLLAVLSFGLATLFRKKSDSSLDYNRKIIQ